MVEIFNMTDVEVDTSRVSKIIEAISSKDVELIIGDDEYIRNLNREHRDIDRATDVLSFPLNSEFEGMPLGSLVVSIDRVKDKASELGHSIDDELALLVIHGMLHLLGMDHEVDNGQMREAEKEWIEYFNLPESLIVRSQKE